MPIRARTIAIVVNWNGASCTARCLDDLAASDVPLDVLVVDNASDDGSVRELAARPVDVLSLAVNRGFGAALNRGIEHIRGRGHDYVWLLNNDIRVPPSCHRLLLAEADGDGSASVWTPRLLAPGGEPQHVGGVWAPDGSRARLVSAADAAGVEGAESAGLWLTGTALFCALDTVARIGPFDESCFAYWEDVDWSLRASRAGVRLRVAAEATLTHLGSQASGGHRSALSTFLIARNEIRLVRRQARGAARRRALLRVVARQLRAALILERRVGRDHAEIALAGLVAGLAGQRGPARVVGLPSATVSRVLASALAMAHRLDRTAAQMERSPTAEVLP